MTPKSLARYTVDKNGCWIWQGALTTTGYGSVRHGGSVWFAHRAFYETHVGPIPEGLVLDHLCRTRPCVNPEHLEPVTNRLNILRGEAWTAVNARKTHCLRGHQFSADNTMIEKNGSRRCRTCARQANRDWRHRSRMAAANIQERAA